MIEDRKLWREKKKGLPRRKVRQRGPLPTAGGSAGAGEDKPRTMRRRKTQQGNAHALIKTPQIMNIRCAGPDLQAMGQRGWAKKARHREGRK